MAKCIEKTPAKFDDAVAQTEFGKFNIFVILIGGGCLMSVILETMGMMFVIPAAECDLELDLTFKGLLASISFLGVVSSSHLWGFLADTRGRRNVLLWSMIVGFVTSLLSSIAPTASLFIFVRYFNGFFIGGASAVTYAYVGEFHDNIYRPKVVAWIATFVGLGSIVLPALAWVVLPLEFNTDFYIVEFRPWRLLVICIGAPSILFALGLYCLPESPKYLMSQGESDQALAALKTIYGYNTGNDPETFPVSCIIWDEEKISADNKPGLVKSIVVQTVPLFKYPYLTKTFMVCLLQFGVFSTSSGLFMWYPEIINKLEDYSEESSLCQAIHSHNNRHNDTEDVYFTCSNSMNDVVYISSLVIGGCLALLYVIIGSVINAIGAKNLLIFYLIAASCCGIAAQLIHGSVLVKVLIGLFLLVGPCIGIINTLVVELYPTHLRGMALAISLMAGRFGAVAGSHLTGQLIYKLCDYMFYVYGLDHLILIITTFLLPSPRKMKMIEPIT